MYRQHLYNMANYLISEGVIKHHQRADAIQAMSLEWVNKMAISWGIEDIQVVAKELSIVEDLPDDAAKRVMQYFYDHNDIEKSATQNIEIALREAQYTV